MKSITRPEAIKIFGRSMVYNSAQLPPFSYENNNTDITTNKWLDSREAIQFSEVLSEDVVSRTTQSPWSNFLQDIFNEKSIIRWPDRDLATPIKHHAAQVYDKARQDEESLKQPMNAFQRWTSRKGSSKPEVSGQDLFSDLSVQVNYLPQTIYIPDRVLDLGDTIYEVVTFKDKKKEPKIINHKIVNRWMQKDTYWISKPNDTRPDNTERVEYENIYKVSYTAQRSEFSVINFSLDSNGNFDQMDQGFMDGVSLYKSKDNFFFTKKDAQKKVTSILSQKPKATERLTP